MRLMRGRIRLVPLLGALTLVVHTAHLPLAVGSCALPGGPGAASAVPASPHADHAAHQASGVGPGGVAASLAVPGTVPMPLDLAVHQAWCLESVAAAAPWTTALVFVVVALGTAAGALPAPGSLARAIPTPRPPPASRRRAFLQVYVI